mmetsp:Transcript_127731/g.355459  ORF Transcript_127731/g.355459 Transcript_127731/m.355459 type:complete len:282 (+) Transcript_127731:1124-1969(+)
MHLVHSDPVAQVPEELVQLHCADLPRVVTVEALEELLHLLDLLPLEALTLAVDEHEVEEIVEVQVPVLLVVHILEDLVNYFLQGCVADGLQGLPQLPVRDRAVAVFVGLAELVSLLARSSSHDSRTLVALALHDEALVGTLQVLQRGLARLPRKDEELREGQTLGLAAVRHGGQGGLLQALPVFQLLRELLRGLRDVQPENLDQRVAEALGSQKLPWGAAALLRETVEDPSELGDLASHEALGPPVDRKEEHQLFEVKRPILVRVHREERLPDHAPDRDET